MFDLNQPWGETISMEQRQYRALATLPREVQLEIIGHLSYPDALSLKLTSRQFYTLAQQSSSLSVIARITWLLSRAQMNLPIPKSEQLRLRSDAEFVNNREVQSILARRRRHEECADTWRELGAGEKWPGCMVVSGVMLCDRGVEILESKGVRRPVWTCNGGLVYISERMVRDLEAWKKSRLRQESGIASRALDWVVADPWRLRGRLRWHGTTRDIVFCHIVFALLVVVFAVYLGWQRPSEAAVPLLESHMVESVMAIDRH